MPDFSPQLFADRFNTLCAQRRLTQAEVADRLGIGKSTVGRWVAGENEPTLSGIRSVAEFFSCSADYLCGLSDHPQALRPGDWLVDLVVLDAALAGKPLGPTERLGTPIPARFQVVDSSRYAALDAQARDALRPRKKPR